jgi:hypothetical protein
VRRLVKVCSLLTALLLPVTLTAACGSDAPTTMPPASSYVGPASSLTQAIINKAPHAYTGMCQAEWQGDGWRQPRQPGNPIAYRSDGEVPVPCANLSASIGTTSASAQPPLQRYARTEAIDGNSFTTTDKIWIKANQQAGGDWLISWGVKPGVNVEWLFTFDGPDQVPAGAQKFLWKSPDPQKSYPDFSVYANDKDAPPGRYVAITGPPVPNP